MCLVYSYYMGAHPWWWMSFRQPFSTASELFVENTSSCRIKLIMLLIYQIRLNPTTAPSTNPFGWPPTCWIGVIYWINAIGGVNGTPWWCLWGELCRRLTEWEFFIPAQTKIVVKLLISIVTFLCCVFGICNNLLVTCKLELLINRMVNLHIINLS